MTTHATLTTSQTLTNKTLTSPVIGTITNTGTLTLPTDTDTLVGRATTDTLTNKTLTAPVLNAFTGTGGAITVADEGNTVGLTVTQNDITNNPVATTITNTGTGNALFINQDGNGIALNIDSEATSANAINIASTGSGKSLNIAHAGTGEALYSLRNVAGATSSYAHRFETGSSDGGYATMLINQANNKRSLVIAKTNAGNEDVVQLQNSGTGEGLLIDQNANGTALNIDTEATTVPAIWIYADVMTSGDVIRARAESASFTGDVGKFSIGNAGASGIGVNIYNEGTGNGLLIDQNGNGTALNIDTEVANDGLALDIAVAGTSPQNFSVYRNDDVTGNVVLRLGSGYLWVDTNGDLRISSTQPTSDTGGTIVGTQS